MISKQIVVPFCVVPLRTAAGCGCPGGGALAAGTGMIPRAESAAKEDDGSCTGMGAITAVCGGGGGCGCGICGDA